MARNIVFEGTSITVASWHNHYRLNSSYVGDTYTNLASSGAGLSVITNSTNIAAVDAAYDSTPGVLNILFLEAGANDFYSTDTATNLADLESYFVYCDARRTRGYKVIMATLLPQSTATGIPHNTSREYLNPLIRAACGVRFDALCDWAADPVIGPDAAAADPLLWSDYVHPAAEGSTRMTLVARKVLDSFVSTTRKRFILSAGLTTEDLLVTAL